MNPADVASIVAGLVAEGCDREKATTIAVHVRTVLWPAMEASRSPRRET